MRIGCIGTGKMGGPIAGNLARAGHDVIIFQRRDHSTPPAAPSASRTRNLRDLAPCEVVLTCLPLPRDVETVMTGPKGLLASMAPGSIYIDMSTIDPGTSHRLEAAALRQEIEFLQCTLGKTPDHAAKAQEPMFIGGSKACFERLAALWPVMGSPVHYLGTVDAACAIKLVSNMIGMANLVVLCEGLQVLHKAGLDMEKAIELLQDTGARSFQLDVRGPWIAAEDDRSRFGLDLALKDVRLGCEMADSWSMDIPTMKTVLNMFQEASAAGHGDKDCCGVRHIIT
ncbi:NAD(P)-dependent oxidoreductase [Desulfoplanes formicivorans]|uniref:6-phosphogluconate dehydrogenase n=1 Tax=Desulfoplanes formicivorans TaxID=1592317 RepID=A0A194AGK2_9BACT|nr:NAD(P)-dependent oxidoreductase [Desulfoplanes formicivorans]GAU08211.1 6-phosphogluconate dehydrogenase [Desulfoplanes formicivorans]